MDAISTRCIGMRCIFQIRSQSFPRVTGSDPIRCSLGGVFSSDIRAIRTRYRAFVSDPCRLYVSYVKITVIKDYSRTNIRVLNLFLDICFTNFKLEWFY